MKTAKQSIDLGYKGTKKRLNLRTALISLCMFAFVGTSAQTGTVTVKLRNASVKELFSAIEKQTSYRFSYRDAEIKGKGNVTISATNRELKQLLEGELSKLGLKYAVSGNKIIVTPVAAAASAQPKKVTGKVVDANGEPVIGATIKEQGTANGTITDFDGNFALDVADNAMLEVSYIGYKSQELKAVAGRTLSVTLREDTEVLDEVVVVGYGTQKKVNLTGAVSSVKVAEVLGDRPLVSASEALQGAVPGLLVSNGGNQAGTGKSFQIRGAYTIGMKDSEGNYGTTIAPLVLIDNVEGDIDMLNPEDIESISVLKDASSTAIYGARAAGGVILVTTKRPKNGTAFSLNYNNNFSFSDAVNLPEQASVREYLRAYSDAAGDQFWTVGAPSVKRWMELLDQRQENPSSVPTYGDGIYLEDGALYFLNENDLFDNMLETGFQMTHNISMSGGTDKLRYRISGSYLDNDGVLVSSKDKYNRLTFSSYISADVTKWFTQEATVNYAHSKKTNPSSPAGGIYNLRLQSFQPEGVMPEEADLIGGAAGLPFQTPRNEIMNSNPAKKVYDNPRIFLKSILKPFKGFEAVFEYTFNKNVYDYNWYTGAFKYTNTQGAAENKPAKGEDYLEKEKRSTDYNAFNIYGTYGFKLDGGHDFKLMAGFNQETKCTETMKALSYGQSVVNVPSLGGGTTKITATDSYDEFAIRGGFFRVNYNYKDKYLLEVNGRYDGSSKFPKENRFGFFPSGSVGWQIAEEDFMSKTRTWMDMLKLRASYGVVGNQNIDNYLYYPTMDLKSDYNKWLINNSYLSAINTLPSLVRYNFTWEEVATVNIGVDFVLLNNRLNGTFEWYQKNTTGMLAPGMQLSGVVGADAPFQNTADMRTRGWDLNVNWRDKIGEVGYRIGLNLSDYKSVITKYDSNESKLIDEYYEGKELGEIWGYVFDGFYTVDDFKDTKSWQLKDGVVAINGINPRPGDVKFKNLRDDETVGENIIYEGDKTLANPGDQTKIGNTLPRYLYGITLGVNYAGFDLNVFLEGTGKRDAWIANELSFPLYYDYKFVPLYEGLSNYWQPVDAENGDFTCANPDAEFPRIYGNYGNQSSNYRKSDRYLSDASYLRIKNVTLSYVVPKKWLSKLFLKQLKGFISIENLATFSSLPKGIDPETLNWNYPSFRTVSFGINFTL